MNIETIQLKGKAHMKYIFNLAIELWDTQGHWTGEFDDWIKVALKIHRETIHKETLNVEEELKDIPDEIQHCSCSKCGKNIDGKEKLCSGLCTGCWIERYIKNRM